MINKEHKQIETIEKPSKLDLSLLKKKSNAKTPSGLLLSHAKEHFKQGNHELAYYIQELYKQVKNMETKEVYIAKQWRGKSGVTYQEQPDKVIAIRFRREEPYSEPKEVRIELLKEEINKVSWAINQSKNKIIETSEIAERVYNKSWKQVFSSRKQHIKLTEILNYLEHKNKIIYSRRGKIQIIK